MKKLILISLMTILLFSCKKENQDLLNTTKKAKYFFYIAEVNKNGDSTKTGIVVAQ